MNTCKAIMEQKDAKGKQCWRPPKENGYCGIHQKHALIQNEIELKKKKCKTYRCIEFLNPRSTDIYCNSCITIKKSTLKNLCKAIIDQGPRKGLQCSKETSLNSEYCGKHVKRQILVESAQQFGLRICGDGKRACKNYTEHGNLLCQICLQECRSNENKQYHERKHSDNQCITCGISIETKIIGENEKEIQRCQQCYHKMKEIEVKRIRDERNYNEERKRNRLKHYTEYKKGASVRNIWFELTIEEFVSLVDKPCFYCDAYNSNESMGVDRLYSDIGYCVQNCVSCCKLCNFMKSDLTPLEFIEHIEKISKSTILIKEKIKEKCLDEKSLQSLKDSHQSYIRPAVILNYVKTDTLQKYIDLCIQDKRSDTYIEKIRTLKKGSNIQIRNAISKILKSSS